MTVTFDFTVLSTPLDGIIRVMPNHEDAYNYLVEEAHLSTIADGSAPLFSDELGDFISDAGHAHLCVQY